MILTMANSQNGVSEFMREQAEQIQDLDALIKESNTTLCRISSVFPFQIFPDELIVDANKATIIRRNLLAKRSFPILIDDILTIKVTRGIFFASMIFEVRGFESNPSPITFLWPEKATEAKMCILGIMNVKKSNIDISKIPIEILKDRLTRIGEAEEEVVKLL